MKLMCNESSDFSGDVKGAPGQVFLVGYQAVLVRVQLGEDLGQLLVCLGEALQESVGVPEDRLELIHVQSGLADWLVDVESLQRDLGGVSQNERSLG